MMEMSSGMSLLWSNRKEIELPLELKSEYLDQGVVGVDECVFFRREWRGDLKHVDLNVVHSFCRNLTGYECSINKFHIEDYCVGYSNEDLANVSFAFLAAFSELWQANFNFPCVAILSCQFFPIFDEEEIVPTAVFRFHKKLDGEISIEPEEFIEPNQYVLAMEISANTKSSGQV